MQSKDLKRKLSFMDYINATNMQEFPRYQSILARQSGEGVGIEEIDSIQMELENLLVSVLQRTRKFKLELMVLDEALGRKSDASKTVINNSKLKSKSFMISNRLASANSIRHPNSIQQIKKLKPYKAKSLPVTSTRNLVKSDELNNNSITTIRNDKSDLFWNKIQTFCDKIDENDLKLLQEQIEINDKIIKCSIPSVKSSLLIENNDKRMGQVFTRNSERNLQKKSLQNSKNINKNLSTLVNETKSLQTVNNDNEMQYGPLTQCLISALIEQNLMTPFDTDFDYFNKNTAKTSLNETIPAINLKQAKANTSLLENNIKKELINQGMLDTTDCIPQNNDDSFSSDIEIIDITSTTNKSDEIIIDDNDSEDEKHSIKSEVEDEISNEIVKLKSQLLLITEKCKDSQQKLLSIAKLKIKQQNIRKEIDRIDVEIQECLNKMQSLKQKNKQLSLKEREKLKELVKQRDQLKSQMNQITIQNSQSN